MVKYLIIGAFIIIVAVVLLRSLISASRKCRLPAAAKIVDVKQNNFGKDGDLYVPILEFYANGKTIRSESAGMSGESSDNKYHIGESVEVRYNSDNPEEFVIEGQSNKGGIILAVVFLVIGMFILSVGIYGFIMR